MLFLIFLFAIALIAFGRSLLVTRDTADVHDHLRLGTYFVFYIIVTFNIINQVWNAQYVNKNVIIGLMSGYMCLGLLCFFIFMGIKMTSPGSFQGVLLEGQNFSGRIDSLLYYSYITLLTIGYGEIIPITPVAQKAAILTGLIGQFYLVIITAVVVEKYIIHKMNIPK